MKDNNYIYKDHQYKLGSGGNFRCYQAPDGWYCWGWEFNPDNDDYSYHLQYGTWEEWLAKKAEMQREILDNR